MLDLERLKIAHATFSKSKNMGKVVMDYINLDNIGKYLLIYKHA